MDRAHESTAARAPGRRELLLWRSAKIAVVGTGQSGLREIRPSDKAAAQTTTCGLLIAKPRQIVQHCPWAGMECSEHPLTSGCIHTRWCQSRGCQAARVRIWVTSRAGTPAHAHGQAVICRLPVGVPEGNYSTGRIEGERMKRVSIAAATLGILVIGGCGNTSTHHLAAASAPTITTAPTLTASQGAVICNDFKAWLPGAFNQRMPRFNAQLESDETEAGDTPLGTDLLNFDSNLQDLNGSAFFPSPPGYAGTPTGIGALQQDCATYGVTFKLPGD
jgi:hypothetical protein